MADRLGLNSPVAAVVLSRNERHVVVPWRRNWTSNARPAATGDLDQRSVQPLPAEPLALRGTAMLPFMPCASWKVQW